MTKQLIYILHLPNGTHLQTRPYKSFAGLQNAARTLIEEADMEPSTRKAYQQNASKQLAALGIANRNMSGYKKKQKRHASKQKEKQIHPHLLYWMPAGQ